MIGGTSTSFQNGSDRRAERRAVAFAIQASLLFLFSFASVNKPVSPKPQPTRLVATAAWNFPPPPVESKDPNERYRSVPESFKNVDFRNWSYGRYPLGGSNLSLTLADGAERYDSEFGTEEMFHLKDVFYADVVGDEKREAIVMLSHVQCSGLCDGGSDLFYVYTDGENGLEKIWEFETGSVAYGCSLKSLFAARNVIVLEMFGRCPPPSSYYDRTTKYVIADTTKLMFGFDGRHFTKRLTETTAVPARDVRIFKPYIEIQNW